MLEELLVVGGPEGDAQLWCARAEVLHVHVAHALVASTLNKKLQEVVALNHRAVLEIQDLERNLRSILRDQYELIATAVTFGDASQHLLECRWRLPHPLHHGLPQRVMLGVSVSNQYYSFGYSLTALVSGLLFV